MIRLLLEHHADPNSVNGTGSQPLHIACAKPCLENAQILVDAGASLQQKDKYRGWTALQFAVEAGDASLVKYLTTKGAELNARDYDGATAMHWAAYNGHDEIITVLVDAGADVNVVTGDQAD